MVRPTALMIWSIGGGILSQLITVFAQTTGAESIFLAAINYAGLGVVALVALYLLRDQSKLAREQLGEVTKQFADALTAERSLRETGNRMICDKVGADHQSCRIEHLGLGDRLARIEALLEKIAEDDE